MRVVSSEPIDFIVTTYVADPFDLQILQDAITVKADYLITHNLKDFLISLIEEDLNIQVV
jgi:predicted nucleic acid-binding protein